MNFKKSNRSIRIVDAKKIACLMTISVFMAFGLNAQTQPDPPTSPQTTSTTTSSSTSSHSISIEDDHNQTHNSSVSISISDGSYKFRASYHKSKNEGVKALLLNELGKDNLTVNGNTYLWTDSNGGDEVFECKLTKGNLRMFVDKDIASKSFVEKIDTLGKNLKYYISGTDAKEEQAKTAEEAQRKLEEAERELAKAKRELEQAKLEAKKTKGN